MNRDRSELYTVASETPLIHLLRDKTPASIAVSPAGTLVVEVKITEQGAFQSVAGLTLHDNLSGTVSTMTRDVLMGPAFAVRFTASTGDAVVEIAQ